MSTDSTVWRTLAIAPTSDLAEIRRAYAAKLKLANPEDDAEGFKKLRAAYETAVQWARHRAPQRPDPMPAASTLAPPTAEHEIPHEAQQSAVPEQPIDPEIGELQNAFETLRAALAPSGAGADRRAASALESFLSSPALGNVNVAREAEWRLSNLLATAIPRSDPLLGDAAQRFGWRNDGLHTTPAVGAVLARLNDLAFLETLQKKGSPYAAAFRGLQRRKIPVWSWLRAHVHTAGTVSEHQLLQMIRVQHPGLIPLLNPNAVAWWDRLASRPQLSFALLMVGLAGGGSVLVLGWENGRVLAPGIFTAAAALGAALWKLYLLDWPRYWLRRTWPIVCPVWLASGWLPLAVLCLAGAVVAPDQLPFVVAGLCALAVQWALIVRTAQASSNPTNDLVVDFLVPQAVLALWWFGSNEQFPVGTMKPMLIPFFALLIASSLGALTLRVVWLRQITLQQRRAIAATLLLTSIGAASLLWWLSPQPEWRPACAALVVTLVALHRPLTCALSPPQLKARAIWGLALFIGLIVALVAEVTSPALKARGGVFAGFGLILLATSTFSAALVARTDLRADARDA